MQLGKGMGKSGIFFSGGVEKLCVSLQNGRDSLGKRFVMMQRAKWSFLDKISWLNRRESGCISVYLIICMHVHVFDLYILVQGLGQTQGIN